MHFYSVVLHTKCMWITSEHCKSIVKTAMIRGLHIHHSTDLQQHRNEQLFNSNDAIGSMVKFHSHAVQNTDVEMYKF